MKKIGIYNFMDVLDYLFGFVSFVAAIFGIINYFSDKGVNGFLLITVIIFASLFVGIKIYKIRKYSLTRLSAFTNCFHKFNHMSRDVFYELCNVVDDNKSSEMIKNTFSNYANNIINLISYILTRVTGEEIYISLMLFSDDDFNNGSDDLTDITANVYARSQNTPNNLSSYTQFKVLDNTALSKLVKDNLPSFKCADIKKYSNEKIQRGEEYRNTIQNCNHYFNSQIVVPIRIVKSLIYKDGSAQRFEILGAIEAITKNKTAFKSREIDHYTNFLLGICDGLVPIIDYYINS